MPEVFNPKTGGNVYVPFQNPVSTAAGGQMAALNPYAQMQQQHPLIAQNALLIDPITGRHDNQMQQEQAQFNRSGLMPSNTLVGMKHEQMTSFLDTLPPLPTGQAYLMHNKARNSGWQLAGLGDIYFDAKGVAVVHENVAKYCLVQWPQDYAMRAGGGLNLPPANAPAAPAPQAPSQVQQVVQAASTMLQRAQAEEQHVLATQLSPVDELKRDLAVALNTLQERDAQIEEYERILEDKNQELARIQNSSFLLPPSVPSLSPVQKDAMLAIATQNADNLLTALSVLHPALFQTEKAVSEKKAPAKPKS